MAYNNFTHIPIAVAVQLVGVGLLSVGVPAVVVCGIGGFTVISMRSVTKAEYDWIEHYGNGLRANMKWYEGLKFWKWNTHTKLETLFGEVAVCLVALASLQVFG